MVVCLGLAGCTEDLGIKEEASTRWRTYNKGNSLLPNDQVQAISIDSEAATWVGTADGLARFDGCSWLVYDTINSAIPSNFITALESGNGDVWVGTNRGLARYDGSTWESVAKLKGEAVTKLHLDPVSGVLWVGTENGLYKYDGDQWEGYEDPGTLLLDFYVSSLATDPNGILWLGSFDHYSFTARLLRFDGTSWSTTKLDRHGLPSSFPDALLVEGDKIWLGVKGTMGGMLVEIRDTTWNIYSRGNTGCAGMGGGINALAIEGRSKWIASGTGLIEYDGTTWRYYDTGNSDLPDNFTSSIAIDHNGFKWVGTIGGGLAVLE